MNAEIKAKWVAALRSGEYQQGRNWLNGDGMFCCLGVLCDLHAMETGGSWIKQHGLRGKAYKHCEKLPPNDVVDWADLDQRDPVIGRPLSRLNDSGKSFEEIADLIEAHL